MTSVQERLQLKRMALDNWSTREKLCLASAVSCSGDQNWMSVSRSLKMLCGANRPADWFSQKSCAVQYGELLENVETPKRKKRTVSERDSSITETPTESILRKLTQERIVELKAQIQKDQEDYSKLREDILLAQSSNVTEAQLKEMWAQIEQDQEQKILEQQKYTQWLKEREERKSELQRVWRPGSGSFSQTHTGQTEQKPATIGINQKQEEMEVEESSAKHGTAPLLTSLLKSPSPAPGSTASVVHPTPTASTSVRMSAPTITNLLTGGNTTTQITSISTPTTQQYHQIHAQPLTGPIPNDPHQQVLPSPSQAAPTLSMLLENKTKDEQPVQQKPEETKCDQVEAMETEDGGSSPIKDDDQQLMEVFNGLIPDNIDELEDILTNNNAIILNPELLEEESILEDVESLMEDNDEANDNKILTTSISDEVLQQTQQTECTESKNLSESFDSSKIKEEIKEENETSLDPEKVPKIEDSSGGGKTVELENELIEPKKEIVEIQMAESGSEVKETKENTVEKATEEKTTDVVQKIESSDDSSDNTTLQILKDKIQDDHKNSDDHKNGDDHEVEDDGRDSSIEDVLMEITTVNTNNVHLDETLNSSLDDVKTDVEILDNSENTPDVDMSEDKSEPTSGKIEKLPKDSPEVIIITEDSDSNEEKPSSDNDTTYESPNKQPIQSNEQNQSPEKYTQSADRSSPSSSTHPSTPKESKTEMETTVTLSTPSATITIIDTDDDSPIEVTKDDKINKNKRDYSRAKKLDSHTDKKPEDLGILEENKLVISIKKLKERDGSESPLVDDENIDAIPRTRRRYSSTPVIDSIPSSPASSDDREYKAWKKSILMIYNRIATHRHASIFLRPVTEEVAPNYKTIVQRPMDLLTIKKNVENGMIRTTIDFQRDVMLMCQNAIMYNKKNNNVYNMAKEMMTESVAVIESLIESVKRDNDKIPSSTVKGRSRKSHRLP